MFRQKMKRAIPTLLIGFLIGISGAWIALPALVRAHERRIVREVIEDFGLPSLPLNSSLTYAYHNDQFVLEWYGFEFQTTPEQAMKWKEEADALKAMKKLGDGHIDFDCVLRNGYYVEVRLFESHK